MNYKNKKFEMAPDARVNAVRDIADEFMWLIFDFNAGEYLITDESRLLDFTLATDTTLNRLWVQIYADYGLNREHVGSDKLIDIFEAIAAKRKPH